MQILAKFLRVTFVATILYVTPHLGLKAQYITPSAVELQVSGERPVLGESDLSYLIVSDNKRRIWFFKQDEVWSFSVDSLTFTQHPSISFEDFDLRGGYDVANDQFLFWSRGV
jgi:hypothetical protein